jgi:hypothetical protein
MEQNSLSITGAVNGENVTLTGNGIPDIEAGYAADSNGSNDSRVRGTDFGDGF